MVDTPATSAELRDHGLVDSDALLDSVTRALQGHNLEKLQSLVTPLLAVETAQLLESLPNDQRMIVWDEVGDEQAGEVLSELHEGVRDRLIERMPEDQLVRCLQTLDMDDVADIVPQVSSDILARLQLVVDRDARDELDAVLSWPEDTAGGLMNVDTTTVRERVPMAVVIRYLRARGDIPEYTDKLFVVDRDSRLQGVLYVSKLLTEDSDQLVSEFVERDPVSFNAMAPAEDVSHAFERYNLISAPVVDDQERLIGRITIDDVVDVIREEADHTLMAQAGLNEEDDLFAPVLSTTGQRAIWLGVNLCTAILASWVIGQFEATIEQLVALAVLMPIVASMGGNAGTQTLTVIIRGMAQGTVSAANARKVLKKELMVGAMNGLLFALAVMLVAIGWYGNLSLGLIIGLAMIINLLFAVFAGVCLPMLFDRVGIDPALASGVAVSTVTDVVGFFAVLGLAAWLLL